MADAADTPQGQQQAHSQQLQPQQSQGAQPASTPVMRSGDTAVGQQQQPGQRRPREADAAELPPELYNTSLRYFKAEDDYPTLTQKLREYLAGRMSDEMIQSVDQYCTVEQYLRQPATYCADKRVRQRIDDIPGMRVARGVYLLWRARFLSVGEWAGAEVPMRVPGMSKETYEIVKQAVGTAVLRAAQRRRVEPAGAKDEYGQTCEQLLPAGVGKALYASVRDATWGALYYKEGDKETSKDIAAEDEVTLPAARYDAPNDTLDMDAYLDDARCASDAPVLLTLRSQYDWPTTWTKEQTLPRPASHDADTAPRDAAASAQQKQVEELLHDVVHADTLFVRNEVQRVWPCIQYARNMAARETRAVQARKRDAKSVKASVAVRGTPGIGKTVAAGGYVLYKLLNEDEQQRQALPWVLLEVNNVAIVFDRVKATVAFYDRKKFDASDFKRAAKYNCVSIFDCASQYKYTYDIFMDGCALNIVLTSPNVVNTEEYDKHALETACKACCVVHAWTLRELLTVGRCIGMTSNIIVERVRAVGPLPRFVFATDERFDERNEAVRAVIDRKNIKRLSMPLYVLDPSPLFDDKNPTNKLFDMRRNSDTFAAVIQGNVKHSGSNVLSRSRPLFCFVPLSADIANAMLQEAYERVKAKKLTVAALLAVCAAHPQGLEYYVLAFLGMPLFWRSIAESVGDVRQECTYLPPPDGTEGAVAVVAPDTPLRADRLAAWTKDMTNRPILYYTNSSEITFYLRDGMRVYVPTDRHFPLIDAFALLHFEHKVHFIGIQVTIAKRHPPTPAVLAAFYTKMPTIVVTNAAPVRDGPAETRAQHGAAASTRTGSVRDDSATARLSAPAQASDALPTDTPQPHDAEQAGAAAAAVVPTGAATAQTDGAAVKRAKTERERSAALADASNRLWRTVTGTRCMLYATHSRGTLDEYQKVERPKSMSDEEHSVYRDDWARFVQYTLQTRVDEETRRAY